MKRNMIVASVVCVSVVMVFALSGVSNSQTERKAREVLGSKGFHITVLDKQTQTIIGGFKSMSGMDSETEVIEYQDGDDPITRKRPGRTKYSNITLKRGITSNMDLWTWRDQVVSGETKGIQKNLIITVFDRANDVVAQWDITNAWPSKISGAVLDSDDVNNSGVAIEEIELAVEKIERAR